MRHNPNSVTQNALAEEKSSLAIFFAENYKLNNIYDMQMMRKCNENSDKACNCKKAIFTSSQVSEKSHTCADAGVRVLARGFNVTYL